MSFVLFEEMGFEQGTSRSLSGRITIGRDSANAFQVLDSKASRVHAQIIVEQNNSVVVEDLNSTNGTFINEQKIQKEVIHPGDKIKIGNTILVIKEISKDREGPQSQPFTISSDATQDVTEMRSLTCPSCSQNIKSKWKFCPNCGAEIG